MLIINLIVRLINLVQSFIFANHLVHSFLKINPILMLKKKPKFGKLGCETYLIGMRLLQTNTLQACFPFGFTPNSSNY